MKYYILQYNWNLQFMKDEVELTPYAGKPMHLGRELPEFPTIKINCTLEKLPSVIPNVMGLPIFNSAVVEIIKSFGVNHIQYFDAIVEHKGIEYDYKILNILKRIDCIDLNRSIVSWSDVYEDEDEDDKFILDISDLQLNYEEIGNCELFRIEKYETLIAFREDLAQAIINAKCTGLEFFEADGYSV